MNLMSLFLLNRKVKKLADSESDDDDESALSWVRKVRKKETEKKLAEKRVSVEWVDCEETMTGNGSKSIAIYFCEGNPPWNKNASNRKL